MNLGRAVVLRTYTSEALASIVAARLESQGIEAIVQKDDAGGAYPALQMSTGVRLLLDPDALPEAERILSEIESQKSEDLEYREPATVREGSKSASLVVVGLFLLGLAIGCFVAPEVTTANLQMGTYTGVISGEKDERGTPGRLYHYVDGQVTRMEEDRNYDGKADGWYEIAAGRMRAATMDDNFDGRPDRWITFKTIFDSVEKADTDYDGIPDATIHYVNDLKQSVDWHPKGSPITERRQFFEHGVLREELIDTDGDGILDQRIMYDSYERPVSRS